MKNLSFVFAAFITLICTLAAYADIKLPDPQTEGGVGVFEALNRRSSAKAGSFPSRELELAELSAMLWAATGLNREGKGWTVPMAMGKPYCKVYAVLANGVFLYDWKEHKLIEVSKNDIRADAVEQEFAKAAPCMLLFTTDIKIIDKDGKADRTTEHILSVLTGAMTQNVYIAAAAMNFGVRYVISINSEYIKKELNLPQYDYPLCVMLVGKYAL